jgi:hypothetical protein
MIRIITAIVLILHGLIHLIGFVVNFKIAEIEDIKHKTSVLAGKIEIGETGVRILGLAWLLIALAFVISAVALFYAPTWWWTYILVVTILSLIVTILGWPDAQFGAYLNIVILTLLFIGKWLGWFPL